LADPPAAIVEIAHCVVERGLSMIWTTILPAFVAAWNDNFL
jgi:hypothetical protein